MLLQDIVLGFIALAVVASITYHLGRKIGIKRGAELGRTSAPIALRVSAYESGTCPICHGDVATVVQCGQEG